MDNEELTNAEQNLIDQLAKTNHRERDPNKKTALSLAKKGLLSFRYPVGWYLTPKGTAYVTKDDE